MLEHALSINAREQYQKILVAMTPHLEKKDRKDVLDNYFRLMNDDDIKNETVNNDIIKQDREILRNLLSKNKNGGQRSR